MTAADRPAFIALLTQLGALYQRRITEELLAVYWDALQDLELAALTRGVERLARSVEAGGRFPYPRSLRAYAEERWQRLGSQLTDAEAAQIRRRVYAELAVWEASHPVGSARPIFERAWRMAARDRGTVLDREAAWQTWLHREDAP
jgi:hypothetical protein